MNEHAELLARHNAVLPSWLALYYDEPIEIVSGEGRHVVDGEGNRYLDLFGGILTTMTGHGVPEVTRAIQEQAERMLHTSTLYLIRPMIELAEQIAELSGIPDPRVFFTTSGTEANEAALLAASSYRKSSQIIAVRNSYHGRSFATIGITGNRGWSPTSLTPFQVSYMASGYKFRSPFRHLDDDAFVDACAEDLRDLVATTTSGNVAALIAEPIQGVGGFAIPPAGFFSPVEKVCRENDILFISDEVQTGWGRTGEHFWGYQAHGVTPDLLTFAKGLGNGLTIAGVVGRAEVMDAVPANSISTFGGNPLSSAGALANLRHLLDHDLQGNAAAMGDRLLDGLAPLVARHPAIGEIRGRGLMIGLELVAADGFTPDADAANRVLEATKARRLLIGKGGLYGNCLRIAPPLSITAEECDEAVTLFSEAVDEALG
ncbi:MAG: aspartate aminotransferase family protein [Acidimicrobiales bacterium]|nr:aspartate aminotransferase family protein [Acidimicrobiales bacterium]